MQIIYKQEELAIIVRRALAQKFGVHEDSETHLDVQFALDEQDNVRAYIGVGETAELPEHHTAPWEEGKSPHVSTVASLSTSISTATPVKRTRRTKQEMEAFRAEQAALSEQKQVETGNVSEPSKGGENGSSSSQVTDANPTPEAGNESAGEAVQEAQVEEAAAFANAPVFTPAAEVPIADPADVPPAQPEDNGEGNAPVEASSTGSEVPPPSEKPRSLFNKPSPDSSTTGTDTTQTQAGEASAEGAPRRVSLFAGLKK